MGKKRKRSSNSSNKAQAQLGRHGASDHRSAMDISYEGSTVASAPAVDTMDTAECVVTGSIGIDKPVIGKSRIGGIRKVATKRRAVKIRKQKALEKALASMEKRSEKKQKRDQKSLRVQDLKHLY